MTSPKDYRDFALDCLRWAERTSNPSHKQVMYDLARTWMNTARIAERTLDLAADYDSYDSKLRTMLD